MSRSGPGFESELRISSKLGIAVLVGVGVVLALTSECWSDPSGRTKALLLAFVFYVASALVWLLDSRVIWMSRWFTVVALVILIHLGNAWLDIPGVLTLVVIPIGLTAGLIGLPAAAAVAVGETVLLGLRPGWIVADANWASVVVPLVGVWMTLGMMYAVYRPVYGVAQWSWEHFQRAQASLEEVRDRQAELKQVLEDLADANRQLTRLNAVAQGLRQVAEDARRAKEQFVANVSHELRTPLNMIVGFSEMIVQAPDIYGGNIPSNLLADLDVVLRNSQHLSKLIDDVLDLSQIEAGQMALTKERASLQELVEAATIAVRPLFDSKGLYLKVEIPDDLPLVFCDPTRIRQVVLNLLSNAGRFTQRGGVHLRAWQEGPFVVASVADTGSGIAPESMDKLFQPFQQLDGSIRRRYGGSGLGLSISKSFIELHGGRIWVKSEEGVGTTFVFRLPIDPPPPLDSGASRWFSPYLQYEERTHPSMAPAPIIHPRFVVQETGNALQRLLTRYLDGVETVPVASPQEAIRELARVPAHALLVNGVSMSIDETLQSFGESTVLPYGIPVITCYIPALSDSAGALGVADYLVKPVSRAVLLAALDRLGFEGKTLLLVDDEPEALRLFRRMLLSSGRGYRILKATDGQEAMRILCEQRPDAILLPVIVISARDPMGQPIVSNVLAVSQRGGLSTSQLLACIESISGVLSTVRQAGGPAQTKRLFGQPVSG